MSTTWTVEVPVHFQRCGRGSRKEMHSGVEAAPLPPGRVPRVARLMALALRFEELVRTGEVASYSALAALGHVTRARISQIVSLLHLAPDIQEALLFLPPTLRGRDAIRHFNSKTQAFFYFEIRGDRVVAREYQTTDAWETGLWTPQTWTASTPSPKK